MTTLKEALDQLAKGHELDNEQKKLIIDKWQKELGIQSCDDAISREDALMCMTGEYVADMTYKPEDIISKHIKRLRALPFVQPKTKIGQWVLLDECSNSGYYCSECHKKLVKEGWSNTVKKIKYCPNCGAKMINVPDINDGKLSEIPTGSESEE